MVTTQRKTALTGAVGTTHSNYTQTIASVSTVEQALSFIALLEGEALKPESCPKFLKCNTPVCPFDPDWRKRVLLSEDATCFYLTESVKHGAESVFQGAGLSEFYEVIVRLTPDITARWARIRKALERAKLTGSRMTRCFPANMGESQ